MHTLLHQEFANIRNFFSLPRVNNYKVTMKKVILMLLVAMTACNTEQMKYGQGGRNACQFVKEQVPELREDITSVEVIEEDSLLSDIGLSFELNRLLKAEGDFYEGKITDSQFEDVISDYAKMANDVEYSWRFSNSINDSLRSIKKYEYMWRKVYTIRVTMKSGSTKEPRVLMDQDGITPRCMEKEFEKDLKDYVDKMTGVINRKLYGN